MEIGTLTTLLLGYKTAERLYALERIEGKQEAVDHLMMYCIIKFHIFPITFKKFSMICYNGK